MPTSNIGMVTRLSELICKNYKCLRPLNCQIVGNRHRAGAISLAFKFTRDFAWRLTLAEYGVMTPTDGLVMLPRMRNFRTWLLSCLFFGGHGALAGPVEGLPLSLSLDAELTHIDSLTNPLAPARGSVRSAERPPGSVSRSRSMGLSMIRLGVAVELPHTAFDLVLRPDAASRDPEAGGKVYELDRRSGLSYRTAPRIRLVDAFEIRILGSGQTIFGIGSYERMIRDVAAYQPVLEFGLAVRMPRRYDALRVQTTLFTNQEAFAQAEPATGWQIALQAFQGREDRALEFADSQSGRFDQGPLAADPYLGFAGELRKFNPRWSHNLLLGQETSATVNQKADEVFGQLGTIYNWADSSNPASLAVDFRYSAEDFKTAGQRRPSLKQVSGSVTASTKVVQRHWLCFGYSIGTSERPRPSDIEKKETHSGSQFEVGTRHELTEQLELRIFANQERRLVRSGGNRHGGFGDGQKIDDHVDRFAIELAYGFRSDP